MLPDGTRRALGNAEVTIVIFNKGNEDFVRTLRTVLPEKEYNELAAQNLATFIENASTPSVKIPMVRILDAGKFSKRFRQLHSVFEAAYDPNTVKALDNLADYAKATAGDVAKFEGFGIKEFAHLTELNAGGVIGAHLAPVVNSSVVIIPMGAFLPIARSLMSTSGPAGGQGLLNKWLTTGVPQGLAKVAGEAAKFGGRVAAEGQAEGI